MPSKPQILLARIAIGLIVGLAVVGVVSYGVSTETMGRISQNIAARPGGPMTFRFILQPAMAALAALRDGVKDARLDRRPYLWACPVGNRGGKAQERDRGTDGNRRSSHRVEPSGDGKVPATAGRD